MTNVAAIAVPMNVAVDASPAGEPNELPPRPFPDVQPPATLAPYPISTPAPTSTAPTTTGDENSRESQP